MGSIGSYQKYKRPIPQPKQSLIILILPFHCQVLIHLNFFKFKNLNIDLKLYLTPPKGEKEMDALCTVFIPYACFCHTNNCEMMQHVMFEPTLK